MEIIEKIRNIAIIAHVDHGKTTLVDQLLRQSGTFRSNQAVVERVMDSMDLEREKGITIKAKNAAFQYKDYHVNIVDTPGHADFGGEVERILKMIDGVILVVDSLDGPQAQTKFVLRKALEVGAKPIVVINKIDRENARPHKVLDMIFELFLELHATDAQLDFPTVYASAKLGFATKEWKGQLDDETRNAGMTALYDTIIEHIPAPQANLDKHFEMLVSNLDYSDYLGRIAYGKITGGKVSMGDKIVCIHKNGVKEKGSVTKLLSHAGLAKIEIQRWPARATSSASPGLKKSSSAKRFADSEEREAVPFVDIDPPTIKMQFVVNDSPLAGREGKFLTARHIRDRLVRETRTNVSIMLADTDMPPACLKSARAVKCRSRFSSSRCAAKAFEVMVSRPEVIYKKDEKGNTLEPFETLYVETPADKLGDILTGIWPIAKVKSPT